MTNLSLHEQVVKITHVYLGPAADRFIDRQVQNHLHKVPEDMSKADLLKLIDWIRVAVSLITEDSEIVEEYTEQLRRLATIDPKKRYGN
jgi:mannose/fructose/N-acetylgalactosamine-specific phosphotransferase system component IIB